MNDNFNLKSLKLNQDNNLISYCSNAGCSVYNVEPFQSRLFLSASEFGTFSICELLHRTNILAFVSGGLKPKFADNMVFVWDMKLEKMVLQFVFASKVISLKLRRKLIFVAEVDQIHCFPLSKDVRRIFSISTRMNPKGVFEVSTNLSTGNQQLLCVPGSQVGSIEVHDIKNCRSNTSSPARYVNAHQNEIACISMNIGSTLMATASQRGTLIRVFDITSPNQILQIVELRRGSDAATLYGINFSHDSKFLCTSSDKGTVHIFALDDENLNRRSTFRGLYFLGNYVDSQWALANFTVTADKPCVCAFGQNNTIYACCIDETFTKYKFNPAGECTRLSFELFSDYIVNEICEEDETC